MMNRMSAGLLTTAVAGVLVGFVTILSGSQVIGPAVPAGFMREMAARSGWQSRPDSSLDVNIVVRDWSGVRELIDQQRGRVVVLDIWTTTCEACLEEFPRFVRLQRQFGADRVACVSINCDYDGIKGKPPAYYRDDVLSFLKANHATFPNVMLNVSFIDFLDQIKLASTPAILVYGRNGRLVRRFDNDNSTSESDDFAMQQVEALIQTLVKPANHPPLPTF